MVCEKLYDVYMFVITIFYKNILFFIGEKPQDVMTLYFHHFINFNNNLRVIIFEKICKFSRLFVGIVRWGQIKKLLDIVYKLGPLLLYNACVIILGTETISELFNQLNSTNNLKEKVKLLTGYSLKFVLNVLLPLADVITDIHFVVKMRQNKLFFLSGNYILLFFGFIKIFSHQIQPRDLIEGPFQS